MRLSTNLDLRAYAAAHNVTLGEIAGKLGLHPTVFSIQYMRMEQSDETKTQLKKVVDEIAKEKSDEEI